RIRVEEANSEDDMRGSWDEGERGGKTASSCRRRDALIFGRRCAIVKRREELRAARCSFSFLGRIIKKRKGTKFCWFDRKISKNSRRAGSHFVLAFCVLKASV